jgi:hypothetical protein
VPEHRDALPEQMRALLPDESSAVSADEAMAIASIRAGSRTRRRHPFLDRFRWVKINPARSRRPALAWLSVIAVLAIVLVLGFKALPSSKSSGGPASRPTLPLTTTTIPRHVTSPAKPPSRAWPMRTVATTGVATDAGRMQDIAPTADGVYWLANDYNADPSLSPTAPYRYVPASGRVTRGPSTMGTVGSPAITVTGGWVWMIVGVGDDIVVEQFDTSTLDLHSRQYLPVKNNLYGPGVEPVLTATINGPLWIAGGEDLWALNPSTGAVETEFDTGNLITSMSTDPTGNLLYTGAEGTESEPVVTEYSAQTGSEMKRAYPGGIVAAYVAATYGGVWASFRTGMAGEAIELSSDGLSQIAPPPVTRGATFDTYDQIGGVGASISEGTLWVSSSTTSATGTLTCADPATGTVRASESVQAGEGDFIASGSLLYAFHDNETGVDNATRNVLWMIDSVQQSGDATLRRG